MQKKNSASVLMIVARMQNQNTKAELLILLLINQGNVRHGLWLRPFGAAKRSLWFQQFPVL